MDYSLGYGFIYFFLLPTAYPIGVRRESLGLCPDLCPSGFTDIQESTLSVRNPLEIRFILHCYTKMQLVSGSFPCLS